MKDLFLHNLAIKTRASVPSLPSPPRTFSSLVIEECEAIVNAMVEAFLNPGTSFYMLLTVDRKAHATAEYTQFYVEYYIRGINAHMTEEKEAVLMKRWPPPSEDGRMALLTKNTTIVDKGGKILVWVLPGVLSPQRQVWLNDLSCHLHSQVHRPP